MTQQRRFYIVKGKASHGSITHLCSTAAMALDTLQRFQRDAVQNIHLFDPDGVSISAGELEAVATGTVPLKPMALTNCS